MYCEELNKSFENKHQMFAELKANKDMLITAKKSQIKTKKNNFGLIDITKTETIKGLPNVEKGFIYAVISNTNYLDSHKDVHLNGSMTKTVNEQQGKVFYLADHKMEVSSIIASRKNVEMMLMDVDWKDLGRDYEGKTQALVFKIPENKIMLQAAKDLIADKEAMENSIRMGYITLDLAVNSNDDEFKEEYKTWSETYPKLANKEKADESGYFWAVRELKIINEGSMVLFGSNDATPIENKTEAVLNTSRNEPSKDTQESVSSILQKIKF